MLKDKQKELAMRVKDIMTLNPQTIFSTDTLVLARDKMVWGNFRHLLVVEDTGELVGVITERDIATHQSRTGESIFANPSDQVSMAMETCPKTIAPEEEVLVAARRMASLKIGCLPVDD